MQAERFGITKEGLKFNNALETLLKGEQSATTFRISKESELGRDRGDAKLSLFRKEDGSVKFDLHFIRRAIKRKGKNTEVMNLQAKIFTI